jgi:hypothetical protein
MGSSVILVQPHPATRLLALFPSSFHSGEAPSRRAPASRAGESGLPPVGAKLEPVSDVAEHAEALAREVVQLGGDVEVHELALPVSLGEPIAHAGTKRPTWGDVISRGRLELIAPAGPLILDVGDGS